MASFTEKIHQWANGYVTHPAVDQTGLKGGYDFTLHWTSRGALDSTPDGIGAIDAVEKQMGLKLTAGTYPLPAMVIDSVNKTPSPNAPRDCRRRRPSLKSPISNRAGPTKR
jgi:uncharacterized protein (TIGR03435 family)